MSALNNLSTNNVSGILIALTIIFLVSPALLYLGFWLTGTTLSVTLKPYLGLLVFTLWLLFMKYIA